MKLTLTQRELIYLDNRLKAVATLFKRKDIESGLARTVQKMLYKFSPNALNTFLTKKERAFLIELLSYRQAMLVKEASMSAEVDLVQSLIEKMEK